MNSIGIFLLGLIVITIGAELLLKGASKIAALLGIRPIVVGLTVVSIGTSLPELAVGVTAINDGVEDMAIGNIAGTNLVNILLILGLSAAIRPLPLQIKAIKSEVFVMIFSAIFLFILCIDGLLSFLDGLIMLFIGVLYLILIIKNSRKENAKIQKKYNEEYQLGSVHQKKKVTLWILSSIFLLVGIATTVWGADLLVSGAISIAKALGMSDAVIGLTIVAIGTSAPELTTTLVATYQNDRDVAVGNLLGSSITNILIILSITVLFVPKGIQVNKDILWFDLPLAALVTIVCYPIFRSDQRISRTEGIVFTLSYLTYVLFLLYFRY